MSQYQSNYQWLGIIWNKVRFEIEKEEAKGKPKTMK